MGQRTAGDASGSSIGLAHCPTLQPEVPKATGLVKSAAAKTMGRGRAGCVKRGALHDEVDE
jgi:hypothetical protein